MPEQVMSVQSGMDIFRYLFLFQNNYYGIVLLIHS